MARRVRKSRADNKRWDQMISCLRLMNFAFNNVRLYPPTHTEVKGVIGKLHETLAQIFQDQEDIGFGFMDQLLYIEGAMSIDETAKNEMLVDRFFRCRVKYLTFMKGVSLDDLLTFFQLLNSEAIKPTTEHPAELLDQKGVRTIHIVEAEVDDAASKTKLGRKKTLLDWYEKTVNTLGEVQASFLAGKHPDLKPLYRLIDDMMATMRNKGPEPFLLLPSLGERLNPHLTHAINTAIYCCILGDQCGLNSGQINSLCITAALHDIGRLTIPIEWTEDPALLSAEELKLSRQHVDWGYLLLTQLAEVPPQVGLLAARHHDAPAGKSATAYFPDAFHELLALADAYDLSMRSDASYWRKHRQDRTLKRLLKMRGSSLLSATATKLLSQSVGFYPVGSLVQLADGQRAIVVRPNAGHTARPKVFLFEATYVAPEPAPDAGADAPSTAVAAPAASAPPEEPPPVIADLTDLNADGLSFKNSIARVLHVPKGSLRELLDAKKEYLLSHAL